MKPTKPLCAFVLLEYPKVKKRLKLYEKYLMATKLSHGGTDVKVCGGNASPVEEVWCDLRSSDGFIQACDKFLHTVDGALDTLKPTEYALVYEKYFSSPYGSMSDVDMDFDKSQATLRRNNDKILEKLERPLITAWMVWDEGIKDFQDA